MLGRNQESKILEYLNETPELYLFYGPCRGPPDGDLPKERSMNLVEMYSDVSFAPQGGRSVQGIAAMLGGTLIQWETSTAESELYSYIEAITMADSVKALWVEISGHTPEAVTYGDNMAAISIIQNPDGPWRTRHLRLRASVLKERLQEGSWRIFTWTASASFSDVFTKAIVDKNVSSWFRRFVQVQALCSLSSSRRGNARDGGRGGGDGGRDGGEEQGEDGGCSDQSGEAGAMHGWLRCSDVLADNNKGGFGGIFGDWHGLRSEE